MDSSSHLRSFGHSPEGIDLQKLLSIIKSARWWILLIFLVINTCSYLVVRYSKNLYESHSQLRLDIKNDASELGFKPLIEDQNLNVISGEIELIQSRLFLDRLLDSMRLDVGYYNSGEILNHEFFGSIPYRVEYTLNSGTLYNVPIYIDESGDTFSIHVGESGQPMSGRFGVPLSIPGGQLIITKNAYSGDRTNLNSFFIIHSREILHHYLADNLKVQPLNFNANTIRISFTDHNPIKATAIVNRIDSLYLWYSNEQKNLANKQKIDWLNQELSHIERRMSGFEDYFEDFVLSNKTNNLDVELQRTVDLITALDSQRYITTANISDIDHISENLAKGNFYVAKSFSKTLPAAIAAALQELEQKQQKLNRTRLSYSEQTFAVQQEERALQEMQTNALAQLQDLKKGQLALLKDLNYRKAKLESKFAQIPDRNTEFNKNQRYYKLYEQLYLSLMQSKSEFEIAQAGSTPDFKILAPASVSSDPIAPNKPMIASIGLVASIVCIFVLVAILYLFNNKITNAADLESLSVPLLGVVPFSKDQKGVDIHVVSRPRSAVSEAFRTLRTNLEFIAANSGLRSIAISSTISGEGKSFIAMNLGAVLAHTKKKVVLLDLDLRKTKTNVPKELQNTQKGISTVLIRKHTWQECLMSTSQENLSILPSGPHPPNPSELLLNGEFESLLSELKSQFDYIVMDTPPVGLVTDGIMGMKRADVSIYVARANYSRKDFLKNLQRIVSINKLTNMCTILNAVPGQGASYGYGYYEEGAHKSNSGES